MFYLVGADPYDEDQLGRLGLSLEGLRQRDRMAFSAYRKPAASLPDIESPIRAWYDPAATR